MQLMRIGARITGKFQFFGFSYIAKLLRTLFPSKRNVVAHMGENFVFQFPYGDAYWGRLLDNSQKYEAEVQRFLQVASKTEYAFIDCGANFGFLSAYVSSLVPGNHPIVAIEADQDNFDILKSNSMANENRFEVRHNAIHSKSGEEVQLFGTKHEAFSIVETDKPARGMVETLAIRDLQGWYDGTKRNKVIIKLDVEGAEIAAIEGLGDLANTDFALIYEDHGSDKDHSVSRYLKDQLGFKVFGLDIHTTKEIQSLDELDEIKKNPRYGYDFLATNSDFWLKEIAKL